MIQEGLYTDQTVCKHAHTDMRTYVYDRIEIGKCECVGM